MTQDLSRLLQPKSIAVVGGGVWCAAVIEQLSKAGYPGQIWPVHPKATDLGGQRTFPSVAHLPNPPDAAFVGINREATVQVIADLSAMKAGGAVCFASGFDETEDGKDANARLLEAAGNMPILGPNCYGMINAFDGAFLWPDQHGCRPVDTGVAILTQSSNIAINLTMQSRGLPIGYVVTCGNQAQLSMADIAASLLDDPRVTAIGLHIEGFRDLPAWQAFARAAHAKNIPVVALKVGRSDEARRATVSHTASLAGEEAGADALLAHLGIAQVRDLPTLLEALKILHIAGPLPSGQIASISCSGGEASLIADLAQDLPLNFPVLTKGQRKRLGAALGPKVALDNPLDYHTYIWRDTDAMTRAFSAMSEPHLALILLIVDFPRADTCNPDDWECAIAAAISAHKATGAKYAMVASLPELMPENVAQRLSIAGIVPFNGLSEALNAIVAAQKQRPEAADLILPPATRPASILSEPDAKTALAGSGLDVPTGRVGTLDDIERYADQSDGPFVLKSIGLAHKSETGGVALGLRGSDAIQRAGKTMQSDRFLLEEMIEGAVVELLVGVVKDPAHGFVLTVGAGGLYTELLQDRSSVLLPATRKQLEQCLTRLKIAPILDGYRNQPGADLGTVLNAIEAIQAYALANIATVEEIEVNPLIVTQTRAVAADALIRKAYD